MMIYWIIAVAGVIAAALSFPVKIYLKSKSGCLIQWLFLKLTITIRNNGVVAELRLFKKKYPLNKKKASKSASSPKTPRSQKNYFSLFKSILTERESRRLIYKLCRLAFRFAKTFQIILFKCNIGLKDYYWQGIITGWLCALTANENFQISGNFLEVNNFVLGLRLSLWKAFFALIIIVACFPYFKAFRFYRKIVNLNSENMERYEKN